MSGDIPGRRRVAVLGLGYVGLPVAVAFGRRFGDVIAFDVDEGRVAELQAGRDSTGEMDAEALAGAGLRLTADPADLNQADFYIIAVPTPIDEAAQPDLSAVRAASRLVGAALSAGDVVVYESTVYPGATEEECAPILAAESGLALGRDFAIGYSPERINPGDPTHRFETITKVVSASDPGTLEIVAQVYRSVVEAGVYRAESIKVAEAAKVIENTQRDLNIALMNELSLIFDRLGLPTQAVLAAAGTKWNFMPFTPGLVGGHCVGVDPYYLTYKAKLMGYEPEVILAGRRINDNMGVHVATKLIKLICRQGVDTTRLRIGVFGLTFKEDVADCRNSRVFDIIAELQSYGAAVLVHDAVLSPDHAAKQFGLEMTPLEAMGALDAAIVAVPHRLYLQGPIYDALAALPAGAVIVDVKSRLDRARLPRNAVVWSL